MMMGTSLSERRILQTSVPKSRGIITLRITASNWAARAFSSASSPSRAVSTWKCSCSRLWLIASTTAWSSSATRMRAIVGKCPSHVNLARPGLSEYVGSLTNSGAEAVALAPDRLDHRRPELPPEVRDVDVARTLDSDIGALPELLHD